MKILVKFWNNNLQKCFWDFLHFERLCSWSSSKPTNKVLTDFETRSISVKNLFFLLLLSLVSSSSIVCLFLCSAVKLTSWIPFAGLFDLVELSFLEQFFRSPLLALSLSLYIWFFFQIFLILLQLNYFILITKE